jgi:hypothetical protein
LVDGGGVRPGRDVVCVRAFQASIARLNAPAQLPDKPANGRKAFIYYDARLVYGAETDGVVLALRSSDASVVHSGSPSLP